MLDVADTRSLAMLYHLNSGPRLDPETSDEAYEAYVKETPSVGDSIALPDATGASALLDLIMRRRSCRRFAARHLALADLAAMLAVTYGLSGPISLGGGIELNGRSVPSAGGLYPLELYVLLERVDSLVDGLYHYNAPDHALEPLEPGSDRVPFNQALFAAPYLENANALVFISAVFDRTLQKYGARGYRFILLEAGHAAQNLCLLAAERGLSSLCAGGFMDAGINRFLGLEPTTEAAVYCVGVGHPG